MAEKKNGWQLEAAADVKDGDPRRAIYKSADLSFALDILRPCDGLQDLQFNENTVSGLTSLQISPEPPTPKSGETVIESYVRGDDLLVNYAQTPARTARPQIEWTSIHTADVHGVQATIAMYTSLLDSDPTVRTRSVFPAGSLVQPLADGSGEVHELSAGDQVQADSLSAFIFRPEGADWSYAEILFPSDFQGAAIVKSSDGLAMEFSLFPEFLEKGVIRKGRIQALFLQRSNDVATVLAAHERLANAPAPLTT